jgi:hypothetical protein
MVNGCEDVLQELITMMKKDRKNIFDRIAKNIERQTGLSREFIDSHSIWELEKILGIPHYSIKDYYIVHQTLKCGCTVPVKMYFEDYGDW